MLFRSLARTVTHLFYRVDRAGEVPSGGAVLLLANHPNALLDPAIIWATAGRDIRFLAKSSLFRGPFAPVLKAAGAIPVYRRIDEGADPSRNVEAFDAVDRALAAGEAVCIFPEGISHSSGRLEPLRTGAARMVIAAERRGVRVRIVAVGLNFDRKTAFRSRVTVVFGRPFSGRDLAETDGGQAARLLTERIVGEMRTLLVELDPETDETVVTRVERLYAATHGRPRSADERIARRRTIAAGVQKLRTVEPSRFLDIWMRLQRYDQRLRRFGLRDDQIDWDLSTAAAIRFVMREGPAAAVLGPLALAGFAAFWVPYRLTDALAQRSATERDVTATVKVLAGASVYTLWLALFVTMLGVVVGLRAGLLAAAALPFLAVAGLFAIERETAVIETAAAWLMLRRAKKQSRARLVDARSELGSVLDEVYEWLSAETRAPGAAQRPR